MVFCRSSLVMRGARFLTVRGNGASAGQEPTGEGTTTMDTHGNLPAPKQGLILTHFITVRDVNRSRDFYADILGGEVVLEENPAVVHVANSWIVINPGGGPTPDKPGIVLEPPEPSATISSFLNVRVADIAAFL